MVAILNRCITVTHDTKKTKKFRLRGLFRLAPPPVKKDEAKISLSTLKKMVTTKEQEELLKLIENETIPSVRETWIEYFLEKTKPSKCKKSD
jgi:hypothetical protein